MLLHIIILCKRIVVYATVILILTNKWKCDENNRNCIVRHNNYFNYANNAHTLEQFEFFILFTLNVTNNTNVKRVVFRSNALLFCSNGYF